MVEKGVDQHTRETLSVGPCVAMVRRMSEIASILIFLGGCVVLVGWAFDIPVLKSVYPGLVTMKANTAVCFVMIGAALWCLQSKRIDNRRFRVTGALCATVLLAIGLATFCEYVFKCDLGIDQLFFKEAPGAVLTSSPGRMAFNTSINFVLIGTALLFSFFRKTKLNVVMQSLALTVSFISLLSLIGYCYGAAPLYIGLKYSTAMALHTTVLFTLTALGILFLRPDNGLMAQVTSEFSGGRVLRGLLPVAIVVPFIMGLLKIIGERSHLLSNEFGVSLVAMGNITALTLYIYVLSVFLNRMEIKRKGAEDAVYVLNRALLASEQSLKEANTGLEKEVKERTKELEEARDFLEVKISERSKELKCLNDVYKLTQNDSDLEKIFQGSVDVLPDAWLHNETACARIIVNENEFKTANFCKTAQSQVADIIVLGKPVGMVELCYLKEQPIMDEGPFLIQERSLINAIAKRLGEVIEYRQKEEKERSHTKELQVFYNAAIGREERILDLKKEIIALKKELGRPS